MAKPGRKAKPTALKLLTGNPGHRPINKQEPEPPKVYAPPAPAGFTEMETAKWNDLSKQLGGARILTELDLDALEIYCREWVNYHEALNDIVARGKLIIAPSGGVMWNPSWSQYKHSMATCRSIMSEFGMTPSTRTSIVAIGDSKGKGEWDEF